MQIRLRIHLWAALVAAFFCAIGSAGAVPVGFSFSGSFAGDDDVQLFTFTTDGSVPIAIRTFGFAGGIQADGTIVVPGGFDPIISLFTAAGDHIGVNDDGSADPFSCLGNTDPATGFTSDSCLVTTLVAGDYIVALTQWNNFALGPTLTDGFLYGDNLPADPFFTAQFFCSNGQFCHSFGANRTSDWALDILGVETAAVVSVPEPASLALLGGGLLLLAATRRRRC